MDGRVLPHSFSCILCEYIYVETSRRRLHKYIKLTKKLREFFHCRFVLYCTECWRQIYINFTSTNTFGISSICNRNLSFLFGQDQWILFFNRLHRNEKLFYFHMRLGNFPNAFASKRSE